MWKDRLKLWAINKTNSRQTNEEQFSSSNIVVKITNGAIMKMIDSPSNSIFTLGRSNQCFNEHRTSQLMWNKFFLSALIHFRSLFSFLFSSFIYSIKNFVFRAGKTYSFDSTVIWSVDQFYQIRFTFYSFIRRIFVLSAWMLWNRFFFSLSFPFKRLSILPCCGRAAMRRKQDTGNLNFRQRDERRREKWENAESKAREKVKKKKRARARERDMHK